MTNLISYQPRGKMITTSISDAIKSYKKDTDRQAAGKWIDKKGFDALAAALAAEGIDPQTYEVTSQDKLENSKKIKSPSRKVYATYTAEIDAAADINNLLRSHGNAAAAE